MMVFTYPMDPMMVFPYPMAILPYHALLCLLLLSSPPALLSYFFGLCPSSFGRDDEPLPILCICMSGQYTSSLYTQNHVYAVLMSIQPYTEPVQYSICIQCFQLTVATFFCFCLMMMFSHVGWASQVIWS